MMKLICYTVAALAVVAFAQAPPSTPCAQYPTCEDCVSHNFCGWCSEPVVYPNNVTGTQCAGGTNFSCNGIYSTNQCVQGYICDLFDFTCKLGAPGTGTTLAVCEANCTNNGQVYLCNLTDKTCYEVPRGTPGASSYAVCMASCSHPSAHPSSPQPPTPPASTYVCNITTGQCVNSTAGHGSSLQVCQQECQKQNGTQYMCNTFLSQCVVLPPGINGETLAECEAQCNPKPNPGPPSIFQGMWRGIAIQNDYKIGEWDMNFTQSTAVMINVAAATTIKGIPYHVQSSSTLEMWIQITSGPGAGQTIKAIGESNQRGPETFYLTAAFGAAGQPAPKSIDGAMTDGKSLVFFLSQCAGTPECVFTMPSTQQRENIIEEVKRVPHRRAMQAESLKVVSDPCSQYSQSCVECIAHDHCGWCSTDVIYKDGEKGTQCAGFSQNENASNAFICNGRYSTYNCTQGYDCDTNTSTCIPDPNPGNGVPLQECQELCRPTPPPTPPIPQYICNITTKKCYKCNETFCPGGMPEATCEAACIKPKPGPTGLVNGSWRGIEIQNSYPLGEWEWFFNASGLTVYKQGVISWVADIISLGGDVMIFSITSGESSGSKLSAIYSVQDQGVGLYSIMTIALGTPNGGIPQSFATPMQTTGQSELVLAKCNSPPCVWQSP